MSKKKKVVLERLRDNVNELTVYLDWERDENNYLRTRISKLEEIMRAYDIKIPDDGWDLPIG